MIPKQIATLEDDMFGDFATTNDDSKDNSNQCWIWIGRYVWKG